MFLVVGLGNPGRRYADTRHSVGYLVAERLAERWAFSPDARTQLGCTVGDGLVAGERCVVARPQSFMNRSGHPTVSLAGYYKLGPERVIVVHDDLELPFGVVRCKVGGGHGGHNGLRDIHRHFGRDHLRVRVGIGRPPEGWDPADYVLARWTAEEAQSMSSVIDQACDAVEVFLRGAGAEVVERFNARAVRGGSLSEPIRSEAR